MYWKTETNLCHEKVKRKKSEKALQGSGENDYAIIVIATILEREREREKEVVILILLFFIFFCKWRINLKTVDLKFERLYIELGSLAFHIVDYLTCLLFHVSDHTCLITSALKWPEIINN